MNPHPKFGAFVHFVTILYGIAHKCGIAMAVNCPIGCYAYGPGVGTGGGEGLLLAPPPPPPPNNFSMFTKCISCWCFTVPPPKDWNTQNMTYSSGADVCATDASCECTNAPGSFTCTCNQGYTGDGVTCVGK